jgi:hypothetical protein
MPSFAHWFWDKATTAHHRRLFAITRTFPLGGIEDLL